MSVPVNSFKFFGLELDIYSHSHNPAEERALESLYFDGYMEIVITITPEHHFVNQNEYRILIVSATDGRRLFVKQGLLSILFLAPFEQFVGIHYDVNYTWENAGVFGADFLSVFTKAPLAKKRVETLAMLHGKGILVPRVMMHN